MINALIQQQAMEQQDRSNLGPALSNLGQSLEKVTGVSKAQKLKKAGQKLFEMGGLTERNLKVIIKMYDLGPEDTRELISTFQTFASFQRENRTEVPLDSETLKNLSEKLNFPFKEGSSLKNVLSIAEKLPKSKEWGSKFLESDDQPGRFISDEPGTVAPEGFSTPESIRTGRTLAQQKKLADLARTDAKKTAKEPDSTKEKNAVRASLEKAIASYERAVLGTNQFLPSENNLSIIKQEQERIRVLAEQYAALGGTINDLGFESVEAFKKWFSGEKKPKEEPPKAAPEESGGFFKNLFGKEREPQQPIYVNPETGQKITWDGKQWIPVQ